MALIDCFHDNLHLGKLVQEVNVSRGRIEHRKSRLDSVNLTNDERRKVQTELLEEIKLLRNFMQRYPQHISTYVKWLAEEDYNRNGVADWNAFLTKISQY